MNIQDNSDSSSFVKIPVDKLHKLKYILQELNINIDLEQNDHTDKNEQYEHNNQNENNKYDGNKKDNEDDLDSLTMLDLEDDLNGDIKHDEAYTNNMVSEQPPTLMMHNTPDELDLSSDDENKPFIPHINTNPHETSSNKNMKLKPLEMHIKKQENDTDNPTTTHMKHESSTQIIPMVKTYSNNLNKLNEINEVDKSKNGGIEVIQPEKKIILNVGGKKFNVKKTLIDKLKIDYCKLHKTIKDDGTSIYFLDRDPSYFSKIISLIRLYGFDEDKIISHLQDYSESFINELCFYSLLDKKFSPRPKLRLKRAVTFPARYDDIITIIIDDQTFETLSANLSRSNYFNNKLKICKSKRFYLNDIDPKIFRYVLNFLRIGESYVTSPEIVEMLRTYNVEYEKLEKKKIIDNIVQHYTPHGVEAIQMQIIDCINNLDSRSTQNPNMSTFCKFVDNKYYVPQTMMISPNVENINVLTTTSKLEFDSDILFHLNDKNMMLGDCIDDLLLCIDIPIIKATEPSQYVDFLEYKLIETITVVAHNIKDNSKKVILQTNGDILYMTPFLESKYYSHYHEMMSAVGKESKILFEDNLIDIKRIILPLFLLKGQQNHLPIRKLSDSDISVYLIVKISPLTKIFKNKTKDIPLLNICLIANFIRLAPFINVIKNDMTITQVPINIELNNYPILYVYEKNHQLVIPIQTSNNQIYDTTIIPLDKYGFIKSFFFTIVTQENVIANNLDKFENDLIEIEIIKLNNNKSIFLHSKMDSFLLNSYIPLKKLGYTLPSGMYYYSFSSNPKSNQILGGFDGNSSFIKIKTKKLTGVIKFYIVEYLKEFI